jgi:hypothetical protein
MPKTVYHPIGPFAGYGLSPLHPKHKLSVFGKILGEPSASDGGKARAASLTPARRSQIAQKAARVRWANAGEKKNDVRNVLSTDNSLFIRAVG